MRYSFLSSDRASQKHSYQSASIYKKNKKATKNLQKSKTDLRGNPPYFLLSSREIPVHLYNLKLKCSAF